MGFVLLQGGIDELARSGSFAGCEPVDETANRVLDVVYTNLTGRAMWVCVGMLIVPTENAQALIEKITDPLVMGGFDFIVNDEGHPLSTSISFLVPDGFAYQVTNLGTSIVLFWTELKL